MKTRIEVFDSFESARETWLDFQRDGTLYVFQTFEWLEHWYSSVGKHIPVKPCLVAAYDATGRPIAFFPFQTKQSRVVTVLEWMGDVLVDYGAPILGPGPVDEFGTAWTDITARLPDVDLIHLSKIPERIHERGNPMVRLKCHRHHSSAHFVELGGSWEDFYETHAGPKTRSTDRRKQRRLSGMGTVTSVITTGDDERLLAEIAGEMVRQKSLRYTELKTANLLSRLGASDFFSQPSDDLRSSGMLHLSGLKLDDHLITTHWGMSHRERYYYFMPSFARGEWSRCSPGRLLLFDLFKWCLDHGVKVFDFTIGDESYKRDWCDREMRLYHFWIPRTTKGRVLWVFQRITAALLANQSVLRLAKGVRRLLH